MHRSKAAAAAALLTVLALLPLAVAPVAAGDSEGQAKAEHERIVKYWTAERIANAKPRDFVRTDRRQVRAQGQAARPRRRRQHGRVVDRRRPVVQRTGKVLFTMDGGNWVCSASAVTDGRATHSLILTAGHCAYDEVNRAFATNWTYVPSFDTAPTFTCAQATYGCWTADLASWSTTATRPRAASTPRPPSTTSPSRSWVRQERHPARRHRGERHELGSYDRLPGDLDRRDASTRSAIPPPGKYKGKDLTYCTGPTFNDHNNGNLTWGIACNMTGGSSGGPWLGGFTHGAATALNSYGYSGSATCTAPSSTRTPRPSSIERTRPPGTRSSSDRPVREPNLPACPLCGNRTFQQERASSTAPGA